MTNQQLAHAWANQTKPSGKGSNLFFEGPSIYSYGKHFEIARIVRKPQESGRGGIILFTCNGYSTTTAAHKGQTARAIDRTAYTVFVVPVLDVHEATSRKERSHRHVQNLDHLRKEYETARKTLLNGRSHFDYRLEAVDLAAEALRAYAEADARLEAERERRAAEYRAEAAEHLPAWRERTLSDTLRPAFHLCPVALRVSACGEYIETSHGARVDIKEAWSLFDKLTAGTVHAGEKISGFPVYGVIGENVKIGCHSVPLAEIHQLASQLKRSA